MLGNRSKPETIRGRDAERHRDRYKGEIFSQKRALKFTVSPAGPGHCGNHERMGNWRPCPLGPLGWPALCALLDVGSPTEPPPKQTMARTLVQEVGDIFIAPLQIHFFFVCINPHPRMFFH
uniref:Uncharacterized protein n=1 Tax=Molossus molossus TaxID=27622 RepID=A0A7J8CRT0_MOLMO|nr:hypothetical protein HJG59_009768 [Molossus molossus]